MYSIWSIEDITHQNVYIYMYMDIKKSIIKLFALRYKLYNLFLLALTFAFEGSYGRKP